MAGTSVLERERQANTETEAKSATEAYRRECRERLYSARNTEAASNLGFAERARLEADALVKSDRPLSYNPYRVTRVEEPVKQSVQTAEPVQRPYMQPVYRAATVAQPSTRVYEVPAEPDYGQPYVQDNYAQAAPAWDYLQQTMPDMAGDFEDEDLRPTETTRQYGTKNPQIAAKPNNAEEAEFTISGAAKAVIAIFAVIVIAAFAIIMVNTAVINSVQAEIDGLNRDYVALVEQNEALEARIAAATSQEVIFDYAESIGMVQR